MTVLDKKELELKIMEYEQQLKKWRKQLSAVAEQENTRKQFVSSREIIDLIKQQTGRQLNMSTIKRWADEGYLGEVIDEKKSFPALRSKQGKKRFLYPKADVYSFLYEKGYLHPAYDVLDQVLLDGERAMVIDSGLEDGEFFYTVQIEASFELKMKINESRLIKEGGKQDESKNKD